MSNPFAERQKGLTGNVISYSGPSGTGKSRSATEAWLRSAMCFGGMAFAIAPVNDIAANVESYRIGYRRAIDSARQAGRVPSKAIAALDFLRTQVSITDDANQCYDAIAKYVEDCPADEAASGKPQFSLLVDEGAIARKKSDILEVIGPLARNLRGIVYVTAHRNMAIPPQFRAVRRAIVLWRSSDGTGEEEIENAVRSIPDFKFSPVMGDVPQEERYQRGLRFGPLGPEAFEFNPSLTGYPDWMLLPALPTGIEPRVL